MITISEERAAPSAVIASDMSIMDCPAPAALSPVPPLQRCRPASHPIRSKPPELNTRAAHHLLDNPGVELGKQRNRRNPGTADHQDPPFDRETAVVFSPDGRTLATASGDQTVRLWGMNVEQAIQRICATTTNTLTPAKWEQYVSADLPYRPPCS